MKDRPAPIAVDIAESIPGMDRFYPGASQDDLDETVAQVEALDRRIVAVKADVRDFGALKDALDKGVAELGHVDIVSANAGIFPIPWVEPVDISNAVLFLASEESRYVTGLELKVDAGYTLK